MNQQDELPPITLQAVIKDLADEHAALLPILECLSDEDWERPTPAPGWFVRDQVTHLAFFDDKAAQVLEDPSAFREEVRTLDGLPQQEERYLFQGRALAPEELLEWWRTASRNLVRVASNVKAAERLPWYGPEMGAISFLTARLMETWSHGLDVIDAVGAFRSDTDRLRHIVFLGLRTRAFSYTNRGLPVPDVSVRVELVSPGGKLWLFGDATAEALVRGPATDFCRVVTQRRHVKDTRIETAGAAAVEWMTLAQAFAGPPGPGRQPGQFSLAAI